MRLTKYGPLDAISVITFRRPERMMTQNGRVTSILICFHQSKTTNRRNRVQWFKNCLDELGLLKVQKIAMPFKIGCSMAKGHWPNYLKMIKEFARQYNKHVIIVVPD